jgi:bifunctional non-homologous end joining protein LigD
LDYRNIGCKLFGRASGATQLRVGGRRLTVANVDKILYPGEKFSTAKVIDYYVRISKYLLPHLKNRPVTLVRFPDGVFADPFYEKDAPAFTPTWVKTVAVPRRGTPGTRAFCDFI